MLKLDIPDFPCKDKGHDLVKILSKRHSWDESYAVVKWCKNCGAVVVDCEYDNRTNAGYYMKMKFPNILYKIKK